MQTKRFLSALLAALCLVGTVLVSGCNSEPAGEEPAKPTNVKPVAPGDGPKPGGAVALPPSGGS